MQARWAAWTCVGLVVTEFAHDSFLKLYSVKLIISSFSVRFGSFFNFEPQDMYFSVLGDEIYL